MDYKEQIDKLGYVVLPDLISPVECDKCKK